MNNNKKNKDFGNDIFDRVFEAVKKYYEQNVTGDVPFSLSYEFGTGRSYPAFRMNNIPFKGIEEMKSDFFSRHKPLIDVFEDKKNDKIQIIVELPGVERESIVLYTSDERGQTNIELDVFKTGEKKEGERVFHKVIPVNKRIDSSKITTVLRNGILTIKIPLLKPQKNVIPIN